MEVSSFPFTIIPTYPPLEEEEEEDSIIHFHTSFSFPVSHHPMEGNGGGSHLKRRRTDGDYYFYDDDDDRKGKDISGVGASEAIFTSLALLEAEEQREGEKWVLDFDGQRSDPELNAQSQLTLEMGRNVMEESKPKRTRCSAGVSGAAGVANSGTTTGQAARRLWVKDRSKDWWERLNSPDYPEDEFRREFRMSRATFDMICEELDSSVTKKNTMLRDAIPVRQRVAVCIWRLATGEPLRLVSKRFGLGISTCHKLVLEVCSAIKNVLMPKYLQWPEDSRMAETKNRFESVSGVKNIGGAMYTTHMPIVAPKIRVAEYYNKRHTERNQKTSYSITVQGVVDERGVFTDICIGWPGSMSDENVLEKSALFQRASRGSLRDVWIVGGAGYPLTDWMLVPYAQRNLTWAQHEFNEKMNEVCGVAREAFARLKGRWACLQKRTEVKLQDLPVVLGACCILHNICEMRGEMIEAGTRFELVDDEMVAENGFRSAAAPLERDRIAHNLLHHGIAGTSFL